MNPPAPSPERIAQWEEQALALLKVRTPPDKVAAHLKYVECTLGGGFALSRSIESVDFQKGARSAYRRSM